ncbi:MAG: 1-acyl-sn-glycerol-3-phosphate acyltransferase [Kineosporiaceae bacterium]
MTVEVRRAPDSEAPTNTSDVPAALVRALTTVHRLGIEAVRSYHRLDVTLPPERLEDRPHLFVANHGFGTIFDLNVFATFAALDRLGLNRPVTALTHEIAWTLRVGKLIETLGARPASRAAALDAFARGEHVLVFPGGDLDGGKSFIHRNEIVFARRRGFARLAVEADVPIVPIVTAGAGESLLVLSDGRWLARALRLDKTVRMNTLPVSVSLPWGINVGGVGLLPHLPLPTKLRTTVLSPPQPQPGESIDEYGSRVETTMQATLSDLTRGRRLILG